MSSLPEAIATHATNVAIMTVRHVVLGKFVESATTEQKNTMFENLRALPGKIPQILSLVVGEDLELSDGNHGFALNVEFASGDDYKVYATHPAHVEVITNNIKPILLPGSRTAVQFIVPDGATTSSDSDSKRAKK